MMVADHGHIARTTTVCTPGFFAALSSTWPTLPPNTGSLEGLRLYIGSTCRRCHRRPCRWTCPGVRGVSAACDSAQTLWILQRDIVGGLSLPRARCQRAKKFADRSHLCVTRYSLCAVAGSTAIVARQGLTPWRAAIAPASQQRFSRTPGSNWNCGNGDPKHGIE